jgi:hypothetical protein
VAHVLKKNGNRGNSFFSLVQFIFFLRCFEATKLASESEEEREREKERGRRERVRGSKRERERGRRREKTSLICPRASLESRGGLW